MFFFAAVMVLILTEDGVFSSTFITCDVPSLPAALLSF